MRNLGGRLAALSGGGALPYDEELEWISCNGNQHFNTRLNLYSITSLLLEMRLYVADNKDRCIFGMRDASTYGFKGPNFYGSTAELQFGRNFTVVRPCNINQWHDIAVNYSPQDPYTIIDGEPKSGLASTAPLTIDIPPFMFALNKNGSPDWKFSGMCEFYRVTADGVLVADYKPVLAGGIPAMYDAVSGSVFFNENTGHQFGYKQKNGNTVNPY